MNELRSRIEKSERQLASIFKDLKMNRTDIDELKGKRDALNQQVKERVAKAQALRDRRDEINKQIGDYKEKRSGINSKTQELFFLELRTSRNSVMSVINSLTEV
ncbi:DUF7121 family protein [Methanosarcina horonobensis]|uniref:DUF7121 family protein n=1 Tax=Methanosarcina horonobensis TaxID=418008 RepID=UPI000ACE599B|nr:hypothetical protein [Methanosarcina horonobensis]